MKLTTLVNGKDIDTFNDLNDGEYVILTRNGSDDKCGIVFKCPGCQEALAVDNMDEPGNPHWRIDFESLSAKPSIYHLRNGHGCGWHGYLTNGVFTSC